MNTRLQEKYLLKINCLSLKGSIFIFLYSLSSWVYMKFQLSKSTLKKLLTGTTIVNYVVLITYVFLLISASSFTSHFVFLLSIPAYVLSRSWLLIVGLFGFEILLITYYWYKNKNNLPIEKDTIVELDDFTSELIFEETENIELDRSEVENEVEETQDLEIEDLFSLEPEEEVIPYQNIPAQRESTAETAQLEMEFDKLWEDAIDHVRSANSNDKKKAIEPAPTVSFDMTLKESLGQTTHSPPKKKRSKQKKQNKSKNLKHLSQSLTPKMNEDSTKKNYSIIADEHREFYNEVALNNWIYAKKADRERIGKFKMALDETRFREKDIAYLFEAGVLYKLLVPHPNESFCIYSIYEGEDKKIINHYLADFCKKRKIAFSQKTISIVNYRELGLDKRIWRLDFQIRNDILGLIWISNFLISDEQTRSHSLSFQKKKELKALLAASQLQFTDRETFPLIITGFTEDVDIINNYIQSLGYGEAYVLAIGEDSFEEKFLKITQK